MAEGTSQKVPDVLGDDARASHVLSQLQTLQTQQLQLEHQRIVQGKQGNDVLEGTGDGETTFSQRQQELQSAQERLLEAESKSVRDRLAEQVAARR